MSIKLALLVLLILFTGALLLLTGVQRVEAGRIIVPDHYPTIQEAVDNAIDGYTIFVRKGTYNESIVVDRNVLLVGEDKTTTVIDGRCQGTALKIIANNVTVTGFTIRQTTTTPPSTYLGLNLVSASNCNITDNIIESCLDGIDAEAFSCCNIVSHNIVRNNAYDGIFLKNGSDNNLLFGNNFTGNKYYGMLIHSLSNNNLVTENNVTDNGWGIVIDSSSNNSISRNNIIHNTNSGFWLVYDACENRIEENTVKNNHIGIDKHYFEGQNNVIFHNSFANNTQQVYGSNPVNVWDDGYPSGGNYWSNYAGVDEKSGSSQDQPGSDGIGDIPLEADVNSQDNYPLMGVSNRFEITYFTEPLISHACNVTLISNSTILGFVAPVWIEHQEDMFLEFNVTGEPGSTGFCRIHFPTAMMNGTYHVFVNGTEVAFALLPCSNADYSYLYFTYSHSTEQVIIIPEFPSFLVTTLFMIATLLAVSVSKEEHWLLPSYL